MVRSSMSDLLKIHHCVISYLQFCILECFTDFANLDGFATGTAGPPPLKGAVEPIAVNAGKMNTNMKKTTSGKIDITH